MEDYFNPKQVEINGHTHTYLLSVETASIILDSMQLQDWGSCGHVETRVNICSEPCRDVCFSFGGHVRRLFAVLRWND